MQGFEALLQVRRVAEEKALKLLSSAKQEFEQIREEEEYLLACAGRAQETLKELEQETFDVRESIIYRRYLNMVRGRIARCRRRRSVAQEALEKRIRDYETKRHGREAISDLLEERRSRKRRELEKQQQREIDESAQQRWAGKGRPEGAGKAVL